jgi:peptidoglycan/LPS O-acetylase OafA/YrhL
MHPATSTFLDTLRLAAACIVLLSHVTSRELNLVLPWVRWGHEAVAAFFVMSGFVIAYVTASREKSIDSYAAARLGRLYSVVLPALLVTVMLDAAGRAINPELYQSIANDHVTARVVVNLLFIQQNWNLTVAPMSNGPFWSLGYEFWYYLIFGAWTFLSGRRRVVLIMLFCACAGPRIVAYLMLWLLGVAAYRVYVNWKPDWFLRCLIATLSTCAITAVLLVGSPLYPIRQAVAELYPSGYLVVAGMSLFLGDIPRLPEDLMLGTLIALMLVTVRGKDKPGRHESSYAVIVRYLAGSTFSIYLFHAPLMYFVWTALRIDKASAIQVLSASALVLVACHLLSYVGERRVHIFRSAAASGIRFIRHRMQSV